MAKDIGIVCGTADIDGVVDRVMLAFILSSSIGDIKVVLLLRLSICLFLSYLTKEDILEILSVSDFSVPHVLVEILLIIVRRVSHVIQLT